MITLKAIGGPRDGKWITLPSEDTHLVKLIDYPVVSVTISPTEMDDEVIVTYTNYTRRRISFSGSRYIEYLAPEYWDDKTSIEHQFTK